MMLSTTPSMNRRAGRKVRPPAAPLGLERLRGACGDDLVERAAQQIEPWVAQLRGSPSFSHLTASGSPFELTFRSNETSIRITVEGGDADVNPRERLARVAAVVQPDARDLDAISRVQGDDELQWGAWAAINVARGGTSSKLYAEVPPDGHGRAMDLVAARTGVRPALDRTLHVRMLAFSPSSRTFEVYYRVLDLRPWELRGVLAPLGLERREIEVRGLLEDVCQAALHRQLPARKLGFSYAWRDGAAPVFSFYGFAFELFGSDCRTRRRTLGFASRRGWSLAAYDAYTAPLDSLDTQEHHGMFGISIGDELAPECRIGVAARP
jgi:hypothetical protein